MIARAYIHVAGPREAGKTAFVEAILQATDAWAHAARCTRDDTLERPRESAPKADRELRRYREAGASGAARFAFPRSPTAADDFFSTDLMEEPSDLVVLEGDSPLAYEDLRVFVAPPLPAGDSLFVRRERDRAAEARASADAMERLLHEPDGVEELFRQVLGNPLAELIHASPDLAAEARANLLEGISRLREAPPAAPTEHWAVTDSHAGIEHAGLVVVNVKDDEERGRGGRLVEEVLRLRKDDALFGDILGRRGNRVPITAVAADLRDAGDPGLKKAIARVKRAIRRARSR